MKAARFAAPPTAKRSLRVRSSVSSIMLLPRTLLACCAALTPLSAAPLASPTPAPRAQDDVLLVSEEGLFRFEVHVPAGLDQLDPSCLSSAASWRQGLAESIEGTVELERGTTRLAFSCERVSFAAKLERLQAWLGSPRGAEARDPAWAELRSIAAAFARGVDRDSWNAEAPAAKCMAAWWSAANQAVVGVQGPAEESELATMAAALRQALAVASSEAPSGAPLLDGKADRIVFVPRPGDAQIRLQVAAPMNEPGFAKRNELRGLLGTSEGARVLWSDTAGGPELIAEATVPAGRGRAVLMQMVTGLKTSPWAPRAAMQVAELSALEQACRQTWDRNRGGDLESTELTPRGPLRIAVMAPPEFVGALSGLGEVQTWLPASATSAPLPERVQKVLGAVGGPEAWRNLKALHLRIRIETANQALETEQWVEIGSPRQRVAIRFGDQSWIQVLDGDRGWEQRGNDVRQLTAQEVEARIQQKRRGLWEILKALATGRRIDAKEEANGGLLLTGEAGLAMTMTVGPLGHPTGLSYRTAIGQPRLFEYTDWRTQAGVGYAATILEKNSGSKWTIQTFEVLPSLDGVPLDPP